MTGSIRRLTVTGEYFRLLTLLAEGTNIEAAQAQIGVLATSLAGLATIATGGAAAPLVDAVQALRSLIRHGRKRATRKNCGASYWTERQSWTRCWRALQEASGAMHASLVALPAKQAEGRLFDNKVARRAVLIQIRDTNMAVANYVALLGALREALTALAGAVRNPGSELALASLSTSSSNLLIQAQAAARALEILRASRGEP